MASNSISFIVPLRERKDHIPGFIHNIKKYYNDFEILFCCQDDKLLFRKGQLSNLGYKEARYDIFAFINLDYRFMSYVNMVKELHKHKRPICTFSLAARVKEPQPGVLKVVRKPKPSPTAGGCTVFTRDQWVKSNGNSNLIIGCGPDDNLLYYRTNLYKLPDIVMGHIVHGKGGPYANKEVRVRNSNIKMRDPLKDPSKDGFNQTIADMVGKKEIEPNIFKYKFRNIRVPDDYTYMKQYKEGLELERKVLGS